MLKARSTIVVAKAIALAIVGSLCCPPNTWASSTEREVVFLLDLSCSMPTALDSSKFEGGFDEVIENARDKARTMLEPYLGSEDLKVSFYTFGDIEPDEEGGWQPRLGNDGDRLTPEEAIKRIDTFFRPRYKDGIKSRANRNYNQDWTYVAFSTFALVQEKLDLPDDPCLDIPSGKSPLLTILALTDAGAEGGGEFPADCKSDPERCQFTPKNEQYKAWLRRNEAANQLSYTHWDIGNDNVAVLAPDEAVYRVQWVSSPSLASSYNLQDPDRQNPGKITIQPYMRLIPEPAKPSQERLAALGATLCEPNNVDALAATEAQHADVQGVVRWQDAGEDYRETRQDWKLSIPARATRTLDQATAIELATLLTPSMPPDQKMVYPANQLLKAGEHPAYFEPKSLCTALTRAYPNSTFILPSKMVPVENTEASSVCPDRPDLMAVDETTPIALVGIDDSKVRKIYPFELSAQGTAPDAGATFEANRWWQYHRKAEATGKTEPLSRTLIATMTDSEGVAAEILYSVEVRKGGEPVSDEGFNFVSFGESGGIARVPVGADGAVATALIPGQEQRFWRMGKDFHHGAAPGDYEVRFCATAEVKTEDAYAVRWSCTQCTSPVIDEHKICAAATFTIEERPTFAWWRIATIIAILIFLIWLTLRIKTEKRFPKNWSIGHTALREKADKRSGLLRYRSILASRIFKPGGLIWYGKLQDSGILSLYDYPPKAGTVIGLRPHGTYVQIWCHRLDEGLADGHHYTVDWIAGNNRLAAVSLPGRGVNKPEKGIFRLDFQDIDENCQITLRNQQGAPLSEFPISKGQLSDF